MKVDYQATDWGTLVQRRALTKPPAEGGWNMFCTGFSGLDWFTPASDLPMRGNGKSAWFGWPDSAEAGGAAGGLVQRAGPRRAAKRSAQQLQLQAFEDVPFYPLGLAQAVTAFRPDISGVPEGFVIFWNVRRG